MNGALCWVQVCRPFDIHAFNTFPEVRFWGHMNALIAVGADVPVGAAVFSPHIALGLRMASPVNAVKGLKLFQSFSKCQVDSVSKRFVIFLGVAEGQVLATPSVQTKVA